MVYIKSLEIENVRCFGKKQRIDFTDSDGNASQWTVILGDNGTGKTTILKSIVSLLPLPSDFLESVENSTRPVELSFRAKWQKFWDTKRKTGEAHSIINLTVCKTEIPFVLTNGTEAKVRFSISHGTSEHGGGSAESNPYNLGVLSPVFCFAYGANRKMGANSLSGGKQFDASTTLFDDEALLQNSQEYLLQLDYETAKTRKGSDELNKVKELLVKILPSGVKDIKVAKTGRLQREVQVETSFGWVAINELSLGYKTTIAWLIDFATKMIYYHEKSPNPFDEPAVLIIDEIDLHMHPAWQREIIENLTKLFPKTQFIVTAHSPLIAQAALDANLVLLKRTTDHISVHNTPEVVRSWRIDQVLTSDLFGLKNVRNKEIEKKITRRRNLIKKGDLLSQMEKDELAMLNSEIDLLPIGETKSEMDAMDILRDFANKIEAAKHRN